MEFESGVIANVELSWLAPSKLRRTVVVGSKKMVVYEDGAAEAIRIYDRGVDYKDPETFGEYQLSYRSGDILSPQLSSDEPLALQAADFVRMMQTGAAPEHGLALARDVVRLAEAAETSLTARWRAGRGRRGTVRVRGRLMAVTAPHRGRRARRRSVSREPSPRRARSACSATRRSAAGWRPPTSSRCSRRSRGADDRRPSRPRTPARCGGSWRYPR